LCTELAKQKIDSIHFESREELKLFIGKKNFQDSVVLIKGSRGMKMEEFVNVIELKYKS
jgi:UDP-N-acetylmuramyl pentapeptide synthase